MIYGELDEEMRSYVRGISRSLARGDLHLAEDLEQETFVAALQSRPRDPQAMRAWLRSITKNCLRNIRNKTARRPQSVAFTTGVHDDAASRGRFPDDPVQLSTQSELQNALECAINKLPSDYANVISMRIVDGMPPRDIAQHLNIPVETVRTRTRRGFDRLKIEVERLNIDPRVLEEPRPLFGLAAFLIPRKRALAAFALGLPLAAIAAFQFLGTPAGPAPTALGPQTLAAGHPASQSALAALTSENRAPMAAAAATAYAELDLTVHYGADRANASSPVTLLFEAVKAGAGKSPFTVELIPGASTHFDALEPGLWNLRHGGELVEQRELLPGPQEWRVTLAAPRSVEIVALHPGALPASAVEIYTRDGFHGAPRLVGITDAQGHLALEMGTSDRWVAARGAPGESSRAILLDQPLVKSSGRVELELETWPLHWLGIDRGPELNQAEFEVNCEPEDLRDLCLLSLEGGISGSSCWLPAWEDGAGRFGIIDGDVRKFACVFVDGLGVWTSPLITRFGAAPANLTVEPTWNVRGRLLTADGTPLIDRPVRIVTSRRARMSGKQIHTDELGNFEVRGVTTDAIDIQSNGRHVIRAERPETGDLDLGNLFHPASLHGMTLSGRVTGIEPPFTIHGLTRGEGRQPVAIQLAVNSTRSFMVVRNDAGTFDLQAGPERTVGIVVSPAEGGRSFPPTFFERPEGGWPAEPLDLHVAAEKPAARVHGTIDSALLPASLQFQHARTGYRSSIDLRNIDLHRLDNKFASPPLTDGTWLVSLQGPDGRVAECDRITLMPGEVRELGRISRKVGHLRLHWPASRAKNEGPLTRAFLVLMKGSELISREHVTREFLEGAQGHLELPAGDYTVTLAIGTSVFRSRASIAPGASVESTPRSGRMVLDLRLPRMDMIACGLNATLEVRGPSERILDALVIGEEHLADGREFSLVADRKFPLVVSCTYGDRTIQTTIEREMAIKNRLTVDLAKAANGSER